MLRTSIYSALLLLAFCVLPLLAQADDEEEKYDFESTPMVYLESEPEKKTPALGDDAFTCAPGTQIVLTDSGRACRNSAGNMIDLEEMPREDLQRLVAKYNPDYDGHHQSGLMPVKGSRGLSRDELYSQCQFKADRAKCMNELMRARQGGEPESVFARSQRQAREQAQDQRYRAPASQPEESVGEKDPCESSRKAGFRDAYVECLQRNNYL